MFLVNFYEHYNKRNSISQKNFLNKLNVIENREDSIIKKKHIN